MVDPTEKLSENFTVGEFIHSETAQRDNIPNIPTAVMVSRMRMLCQNVLQPIRDHFGPVKITSGYRSPQLNSLIGGSSTSQHMLGEAADFMVPGVDCADIVSWVLESDLVFDQIIWEKGLWVHVSYSGIRNRNQALSFDGHSYKPWGTK